MISLDTNVLVRIVTRDDPDQLESALTIMKSSQLFVTKTVLLEFEWVLRYCYDLNRNSIANALLKLLGLEQLEIEDRKSVTRAYSWYKKGMDFADALHLASSASASAFATFDRKLASRSQAENSIPKVRLIGS